MISLSESKYSQDGSGPVFHDSIVLEVAGSILRHFTGFILGC